MPVCISPNGYTVYRDSEPARQLFVGTAEGIFTLEREGKGEAWRVADRPLEGRHISSLCIEPTRGTMFAGIHGSGLYRSDDGGRTWALKTNGLTCEHVYSLTYSLHDGKLTVWAGTEPAYLFKSTDLGETWEELPALRDVPDRERWTFPAPPHHGHVKNVAVDPRDPNVMFVCIEQGALLKSVDGGQSWREIAGFYVPKDPILYKDCHRVLFRPSNPDAIYLAGGDGLHFSPDQGETWEHYDTTGVGIAYPDHTNISPLDETIIMMAGAAANPSVWRRTKRADFKVIRSHDGGRTWEILQNGLPEEMRAAIEAQSVHSWPGGFSLFVGNTDGDVYASDDGGDTWERIAQGIGPVSKVGHYRNLQVVAA